MLSFSKQTILYFLIYFSHSLFGQSELDQMTENFDQQYLEHLIKEKIDSVRIAHQLTPLANDSILYVAAKHHADYLAQRGRLTHIEKEYDKYNTPQDRARAYGVANNYLIGENIAQNSIYNTNKKNKTLGYSSYDKVALNVAISWVNSPGHYKNIITKEYNKTGLAVTFNLVDKSLFIVQKFAHVLFEYRFVEKRNFFPYSNYQTQDPISSFDSIPQKLHDGLHAWETKTSVKDAKYLHQNLIINSDDKLLEIKPKGKNLYVLTGGNEHLAKLIRKRRDGLALEIVSYNDYHCGNPDYYTKQSRRNQQCIYSGRVLKPVYKKNLKGRIGYSFSRKFSKNKKSFSLPKAFIESFEPQPKKGFKYKLGRIPNDISGYFETNLVYIKKKRIVRVRHLTGICGERIKQIALPNYLLATSQDTLNIKIPQIDSTFYFYFPKSEFMFNLSDITPLKNLSLDKYNINNLNIEAYSSIEGNEQINLDLQRKRSKSILNAIEGTQIDNIEPHIKTEVNWELFYEQINQNKQLKHLQQFDKPSIKLYIDSVIKNDNPTYLNTLLDSQRYASINIKAQYRYNEFKIRLLKQRFQELIDSARQVDPNIYPIVIDLRIEALLNNLKLEIDADKIDSTILYHFKPDIDKRFRKSLFKYIITTKEYNLQSISNTPWGTLLSTCNGVKNLDPKIVYNGKLEQLEQLGLDSNLLFQHLTKLEESFLKLNSVSGFKSKTDSILIYLYRFTLNHKFSLENSETFENAVNYLFNYYKTRTLTDSEILEGARLFALIKHLDKAYFILEPHIDLQNPKPELIKFFAKLIYQNSLEFPNSKYASWLIEVKNILPNKEWCELFVGPCNISFQVFDDEILRSIYCESCKNYGNYATDFIYNME